MKQFYWKKRMAALSVVLMIVNTVMGAVPAYAEEPQTEEEIARQQEQAELDAIYAIPTESNQLENWPQGPGTYGEGAAMLDMDTGAVLYGKQMDTAFYPASITKLLTALVALDNVKMTDRVTFVDEDINFLEAGDASIGMNAGEEISMEDAMYAMLLASANEVSHGIIRTVGKQAREQEKAAGTTEEVTEDAGKTEDTLDYEKGIAMMNEKAQQLGCTNSHFVNSYGLHDDNHYTTAHDMCLIGQAVYQYEEFRKITATQEYNIGPTNGSADVRTFQQNHKMLFPASQYYDADVTGGKTGFTDQARTTLVTFAERDGKRLVVTVLKTVGRNAYTDTQNLLNYGFDQFGEVPITKDNISKLQLEGFEASDIKQVSEKKNKITLPTSGISLSQVTAELSRIDDSKEGVIHCTYEGQPLGDVSITLSMSYFENEKLNIKDVEEPKDHSAGNPSPQQNWQLLFWAAGVVVLLLILLVVLGVHRSRRRKRRRRTAKKKPHD